MEIRVRSLKHADDNGRVCVKCDVYKPWTEFHKHSKCQYGYNTVCKPCRYPESKRQWAKKDPIQKILQRTRGRAARAGIDFNIDEEDIIIPDKCPVFGVELVAGTDYAASIDRIDSSKGYVKGNVQIISNRANMLKNNATAKELQMVVDYMNRCEI